MGRLAHRLRLLCRGRVAAGLLILIVLFRESAARWPFVFAPTRTLVVCHDCGSLTLSWLGAEWRFLEADWADNECKYTRTYYDDLLAYRISCDWRLVTPRHGGGARVGVSGAGHVSVPDLLFAILPGMIVLAQFMRWLAIKRLPWIIRHRRLTRLAMMIPIAVAVTWAHRSDGVDLPTLVLPGRIAVVDADGVCTFMWHDETFVNPPDSAVWQLIYQEVMGQLQQFGWNDSHGCYIPEFKPIGTMSGAVMMLRLNELYAMLVPGYVLACFIVRKTPHYPAHCCQVCGYNLTGNVSGRCSECGTACDPAAVQAAIQATASACNAGASVA